MMPARKPFARWILPAGAGACMSMNAAAAEGGPPVSKAGLTLILVIIGIGVLFLLALLRKASSGGRDD
jgi:hypothetical protein